MIRVAGYPPAAISLVDLAHFQSTAAAAAAAVAAVAAASAPKLSPTGRLL